MNPFALLDGSKLLGYGLMALAALAAIGGLYIKVHHDGVIAGRAEIQQAWDGAVQKRRAWETKKNSDATKGLQDDRAKAKVLIQERTVYVDKIVTRDVYRNVCLDADGLRCVNAAIRGESAAGCKPDDAVRTPAATEGR